MAKAIKLALNPSDISELVRNALESGLDGPDRIDLLEDLADWLVLRYGGRVSGIGDIAGPAPNTVVEIELDSCSKYPNGVGTLSEGGAQGPGEADPDEKSRLLSTILYAAKCCETLACAKRAIQDLVKGASVMDFDMDGCSFLLVDIAGEPCVMVECASGAPDTSDSVSIGGFTASFLGR